MAQSLPQRICLLNSHARFYALSQCLQIGAQFRGCEIDLLLLREAIEYLAGTGFSSAQAIAAMWRNRLHVEDAAYAAYQRYAPKGPAIVVQLEDFLSVPRPSPERVIVFPRPALVTA